MDVISSVVVTFTRQVTMRMRVHKVAARQFCMRMFMFVVQVGFPTDGCAVCMRVLMGAGSMRVEFPAVHVIAASPQPGHEQVGAEREHERAGRKTKPRKQLFLHDIRGGHKRYDTQHDDAECMRKGHDQPKVNSVSNATAAANQVRRDNRFAMAGRERMRSTQ
jgi:hypothetical protein